MKKILLLAFSLIGFCMFSQKITFRLPAEVDSVVCNFARNSTIKKDHKVFAVWSQSRDTVNLLIGTYPTAEKTKFKKLLGSSNRFISTACFKTIPMVYRTDIYNSLMLIKANGKPGEANYCEDLELPNLHGFNIKFIYSTGCIKSEGKVVE